MKIIILALILGAHTLCFSQSILRNAFILYQINEDQRKKMQAIEDKLLFGFDNYLKDRDQKISLHISWPQNPGTINEPLTQKEWVEVFHKNYKDTDTYELCFEWDDKTNSFPLLSISKVYTYIPNSLFIGDQLNEPLDRPLFRIPICILPYFLDKNEIEIIQQTAVASIVNRMNDKTLSDTQVNYSIRTLKFDDNNYLPQSTLKDFGNLIWYCYKESDLKVSTALYNDSPLTSTQAFLHIANWEKIERNGLIDSSFSEGEINSILIGEKWSLEPTNGHHPQSNFQSECIDVGQFKALKREIIGIGLSFLLSDGSTKTLWFEYLKVMDLLEERKYETCIFEAQLNAHLIKKMNVQFRKIYE